jgi:hypothetical protein
MESTKAGKLLQALISVSTIGTYDDHSDEQLEKDVKSELTGWFGAAVQDWKLLRNYRIPFAQPNQVNSQQACMISVLMKCH